MKSIVAVNISGKRVDRLIMDSFPNMPVSAMYKAFRKKDIRVNGIRVKEDHIVEAGDKVDIYIVDDILLGTPKENHSTLNKGFNVVYEDKNLIIVNKNQGISVHPDKDKSEVTLIESIQEYLEKKGDYNPPSLCHRLDRNTGGLVIIAKNNESLKILLDKIKSKEIKKYYLCLVQGNMPKDRDELRAYLEKDERKSRVFIKDHPGKGLLEIITRYRVLKSNGTVSKLEVELVTGRTHQIRAHLAHIGHPILGDGKYGSNSFNRSMKAKYQALWAYKIQFDFKGRTGILDYLQGKKFQVDPEFNLKTPEI